MKAALEFIAGLFMLNKAEQTPMMDTTIYRIETSSHQYCGKILYQDNVVIRLKGFKPKPVKILNANIERIAIVKNELT